MRRLALLLAAVTMGFPLAALDAQICSPRPMPPPESAMGWTSANWPRGEAIRFSAAPALQHRAYVVQISRASPAGGAVVHLVKLVREWSCNRWDREQEWTFPLGAGDAKLFFESVDGIEMRWRPVDEFVMDGTGFGYEHRRNGQVHTLRLSATATGESGRLSDLIRSLMRVARGQIPDSPDWYE